MDYRVHDFVPNNERRGILIKLFEFLGAYQIAKQLMRRDNDESGARRLSSDGPLMDR